MKHNVCEKVKCPYYRHEDSQVIYCEGYQDGQVATFNFANRADSKAYKVTYCRENWKNCRRVREIEDDGMSL